MAVEEQQPSQEGPASRVRLLEEARAAAERALKASTDYRNNELARTEALVSIALSLVILARNS